jgi:hypothetical protein
MRTPVGTSAAVSRARAAPAQRNPGECAPAAEGRSATVPLQALREMAPLAFVWIRERDRSTQLPNKSRLNHAKPVVTNRSAAFAHTLARRSQWPRVASPSRTRRSDGCQRRPQGQGTGTDRPSLVRCPSTRTLKGRLRSTQPCSRGGAQSCPTGLYLRAPNARSQLIIAVLCLGRVPRYTGSRRRSTELCGGGVASVLGPPPPEVAAKGRIAAPPRWWRSTLPGRSWWWVEP